jgi:serine/threonine protein kinase
VQDIPVPAVQLNPAIPVELQHIIEKCLEKNRDLRYQHSADIRSDLKRLARHCHASSSGVRALVEPVVAAAAPSKTSAIRSQVVAPPQEPTSRSAATTLPEHISAKIWVFLAALLVALAISGVLYWRSQKKVVLTERDTIVLADFANSTGDAVFDGPLKT